MIDACILCGGIGTRLKELGVSTPKSLLLINNIPFIEIILNNLKSQNINNIILCTGHLGSQFYEKYNNKIQFVIISNDEPETVQKYIKKNEFTMPFYVFKNDTFPVGIKIFPTSHLKINNKTQFIYAGVGYFDNDGFNQYIDSVLVK